METPPKIEDQMSLRRTWESSRTAFRDCEALDEISAYLEFAARASRFQPMRMTTVEIIISTPRPRCVPSCPHLLALARRCTSECGAGDLADASRNQLP